MRTMGRCRDCGVPGAVDARGYGLSCDCAGEHYPRTAALCSHSRALRAEGRAVVGDTYPYRQALRAAGGYWDSRARAWMYRDAGTASMIVDEIMG